MLDVETRGSQSLLNLQAFTDPTAYRLKVKRPGSDESCEVNVDLLETFNWLVGLTVRHIAAPQTFSAAFERDSEKRLQIAGRLRQANDGPFWFRTVSGTTPDGRRRSSSGASLLARRSRTIWFSTSGSPSRATRPKTASLTSSTSMEATISKTSRPQMTCGRCDSSKRTSIA